MAGPRLVPLNASGIPLRFEFEAPPAHWQAVQVRREVSAGSAASTASSPARPAENLCPNCLTACDESNFCAGCGKVVKA